MHVNKLGLQVYDCIHFTVAYHVAGDQAMSVLSTMRTGAEVSAHN